MAKAKEPVITVSTVFAGRQTDRQAFIDLMFRPVYPSSWKIPATRQPCSSQYRHNNSRWFWMLVGDVRSHPFFRRELPQGHGAGQTGTSEKSDGLSCGCQSRCRPAPIRTPFLAPCRSHPR